MTAAPPPPTPAAVPRPRDLVPEADLRISWRRHLALAQFHRLLAALEAGSGAPPHVLGDPVAQQAARASLGGRPLTLTAWESDATAERFAFDLVAGGRRVTVAARFAPGGAGFPPFTELVLEEGGPAGPVPAGANRARAVVHRFISHVEDPRRDPEPMIELLAAPFSLHYTPEPLRDAAAIRAWVAGALSSVVASEHVIQALEAQAEPGGSIVVKLVSKSQALFPDGSGVISRNRQTWTLEDADGQAWPRIREILIFRDGIEAYPPPA